MNVEDQDLLKRAIKEEKSDIFTLESNYNFIEIGYLFDCHGRDLSDDEDILLANRVRDAWDGWLKLQYPKRIFCVEVLTPKETGSTVGVHFFEKRIQ